MNSRKRTKDFVVKGAMKLKLIPAKKESMTRVYHPMVTLTFHIDGGDELIILAEESKNAPSIFAHLKETLTLSPTSSPAHFIKNLYIPTFEEE